MSLKDAIFWKRAARRQMNVLRFENAVASGDFATAKTSLAAGANPNHCSRRDGERPIHLAAAYADQAMIDLLLAAGANALVGIMVSPVSTLSPSGYADFMGKPGNAAYLRQIEERERKAMIASGRQPPIFDEKYRTLCSLLARAKSSKSPPPP